MAMALLMLLSCLPAIAEGAAIPKGYKPVAENSQFRLHLLEETMAVIRRARSMASCCIPLSRTPIPATRPGRASTSPASSWNTWRT